MADTGDIKFGKRRRKRKGNYDFMFLYSGKSIIILLTSLILIGLIFSPIFLSSKEILADNLPTSVTVSITGPICGNGIREAGEQCDGGDLGGQTCVSLGYASGILSCYAAGMPNECTFNVSGCSAGGGGGGGGGYVPPPTVTKVIIQGKAYPEAEITLLEDGKVLTTKKADPLANFKIEITDITAGVWTFSIWAEDKEGRRPITFSFTANVTKNMTTTVSGIFLPPTIELSKVNLQKGETLNIFGQTAPESEVSISVESPEIVKKTEATKKGDWDYSLDTSPLDEGSHTTRAKAASPEGLLSSYSKVLGFYIGEGAPGVICPNADLNGDGKVNLVDFSILLYWWGRYNACADQNGNGRVDLPDFSIMMYYWTG